MRINILIGLVLFSLVGFSACVDLPSAVRNGSLADVEKEVIRSTLAREGGNKSRTAEILGIGRKTLHRKIEEYGL